MLFLLGLPRPGESTVGAGTAPRKPMPGFAEHNARMLASLRDPDARAIRQTAAAIAAGRAALGIAVLAAPRLVRAVSGLGGEPGTSEQLLARLFGVREAALGVAMLAECATGVPGRTSLAVNGATDAGDAVALLGALRHGGGRRAAILGLPVSAAISATWAWLALHRSRIA